MSDREAAADWIDANQLGRRNLTRDQASLLRGRRYNRAKKPHGGDRKSSPQNDDLKEKTATKLATQHGVSKATIERDGKFAEAVEKLKAIDPDIEQKAHGGDRKSSGQNVHLIKGEGQRHWAPQKVGSK